MDLGAAGPGSCPGVAVGRVDVGGVGGAVVVGQGGLWTPPPERPQGAVRPPTWASVASVGRGEVQLGDCGVRGVSSGPLPAKACGTHLILIRQGFGEDGHVWPFRRANGTLHPAARNRTRCQIARGRPRGPRHRVRAAAARSPGADRGSHVAISAVSEIVRPLISLRRIHTHRYSGLTNCQLLLRKRKLMNG